jgi:carbonic anhydrase
MADEVWTEALFPSALVEGYESFLSGDFRRERHTFHCLAEKGQHPHTLVIGCCDSRVMPEEIFAAAPGEIFDVRNVANLVPPFTADLRHHSAWAAVDYALSALKVKCVVVLGHAKCGGVRAFVDGGPEKYEAPLPADDALGHWIGLIAPAARRLQAETGRSDLSDAEALAMESVRQSLDNLRSHPRLAALEQAGALSLFGAYFEIDNARLLALDEASGRFTPIAAERHKAASSGFER